MILANNTNISLKELTNNFQFPSNLEKQFFTRIFSTPRNVYDSRLKQINFIDKKNVLDAGCGYGQWTLSLCDFNDNVHAIDLDPQKLKIAKNIISLQKKTSSFQIGRIENLPFNADEFDAVFSYSVIYWTDYKKSLKEFFRVLKSSGILYFVTNGLGWSIFNFLTAHSSTSDFNARKHALKTISETLKYSFTNKREPGQSIFMTPKNIVNYLKEIGFRKVSYAGEGHLNFNKSIKSNPFYPKKYLGFTNVFEIYAEK